MLLTDAVIELPECVPVRTLGEDPASVSVSRLVLVYDAAITAAKVGGDAALEREASRMARELVPTTYMVQQDR
ncbi:hypothetical protein ABIB15_001329 [Marisediminicola sp. UYEF4]|uniref:hypothetical protein n=1 Tax=Marisediminicola sp. UYEF4 TaxID=1756384 RepID=UPI00339A6410